jgi:hypothetical protein
MSSGILAAQTEHPPILLESGKVYRIRQELTQTTESDRGGTRGGASLNSTSELDIQLDQLNPDGSYRVNCRYNALALTLFAPSLEVSINSDRSMELKNYLNALQKHTFSATLTKMGALRDMDRLNAFLDSLYVEKEESGGLQELLLKTVKEAFGEEALLSMFNVSMNVHGPKVNGQVVKEVFYHFNTHPLKIQVTYYFQPLKEGKNRVQGLGVLKEQDYLIKSGERKMKSTYEGNQTFDLLYDAHSGWMIEGISRQRIYIVTEFHGYNEYPEGLRIPSHTDTDLIFTGSIIDEAVDR